MLSRKENKWLGHTVYSIIYLVILYISLKIWGIKMFQEIYFYLMYIIAYFLTGFILRKLGIWKY